LLVERKGVCLVKKSAPVVLKGIIIVVVKYFWK